MTDNNSNATQNDKLKSQQDQNQKPNEHADNTKSTSGQAVASKNTASNASAKPNAPESQMKKVDIVIAGVTYQIYCPVNEEADLRSAVYYINDFILNIKREAPNLGQENLLVLCCLNLYEKIHTHKKTDDESAQASKQAGVLLSKIMKDAQSIL